MKVGFTGTQAGMTDYQKARLEELLVELDCTEFHHGDCIGADQQAHDIASGLCIPITIHPPRIDDKRAFCIGADFVMEPKDYLKRNHDIVRASEILIACPAGPEQLRSGTWATIRYAKNDCIDIHVIYPSKSEKIVP